MAVGKGLFCGGVRSILCHAYPAADACKNANSAVDVRRKTLLLDEQMIHSCHRKTYSQKNHIKAVKAWTHAIHWNQNSPKIANVTRLVVFEELNQKGNVLLL